MFGNEHPDQQLLVIRQHHADLRRMAESSRLARRRNRSVARSVRIRFIRLRPRRRPHLIARQV